MPKMKEFIKIEIKKKNPKKDPKQYVIKNLVDIFNVITEENVDQFSKDINALFITWAQMKKLAGKKETLIPEDSIIWIDD